MQITGRVDVCIIVAPALALANVHLGIMGLLASKSLHLGELGSIVDRAEGCF